MKAPDEAVRGFRCFSAEKARGKPARRKEEIMLKLVKPSRAYEGPIREMLEDWFSREAR